MKNFPSRSSATLAVAGWLLFGLLAPASAAQESAPPATPPTAAAEPERPIKRIRMYAENWKWTPRTIRVTAGTRLVIEVQNIDSPHRFDLKALGVKVQLPEDSRITIEFVADKPGTFRWRCGRPCGNGCPKMTGKLIVAEAEQD